MNCEFCTHPIPKRRYPHKAKFCSVACSQAHKACKQLDTSPYAYYKEFEVLRSKACDGDKKSKGILRDVYHITMVWDKVRRKEVYT